MQSGQTVLRDMDLRIVDLRQQANALAAELGTLTARRNEARTRESTTTRDLARLRLDLLQANQVASGIDAADQRALALLDERVQALADLDAAIAGSAERQQSLATARQQRLAERDAAAQRLNETVESTRAVLSATPDYQALQAAATQAVETAALSAEKARTAAADRERKRRPYEADKLFMYLWQRRFGFPEYTATALTRTLDQWVARLVGYDGAHRNYRMLLALADHLSAHADAQARVAAEAQARQVDAEDAALDVAGVPALEDALDAAETALAAAEQAIEDEEAGHRQRLDERAAMAAGSDRYTTEALNLIAAQLGREELAQLRSDAQGTASPKDDAMVAALANLRADSSQLATQVAQMEQRQSLLLQQLSDAEQLRTRFRSQSYDSRHSEFEDGFAIGVVLDRLLRGAIRVNDAWEEVSRRQRTRLPPVIRVPRSSGGSSGRGGGFGGGGGFRTGGGFRGGGGFKTGGGF